MTLISSKTKIEQTIYINLIKLYYFNFVIERILKSGWYGIVINELCNCSIIKSIYFTKVLFLHIVLFMVKQLLDVL